MRTLDEAAVISDTYTLSHKKNFWSKNQSSSSSLKGSDSDKKNVSESKSSSTSNSHHRSIVVLRPVLGQTVLNDNLV